MSRQLENSGRTGGRASQKNRTRKALVIAAEELMRAGRRPTVTEAAEAAGISRATAYRYFPAQELLWAEVALFAVGGPLVAAADVKAPLPEAVGSLVRRVGIWSYENEQALRTILRLSLDPSTGVKRPGHRTEWIAQALAAQKDKMDKRTYERLSIALTLLLGIDPVVVMTDIANVSREQGLDALEWTARTLVQGALMRHEKPASGIGRGRAKSAR